MDFRYTPEEQRFRMEVRQFIDEQVPAELKDQKDYEGLDEYIPLEMAALKKMAAKGWLGAAFPKEYGGWGHATLVPMTEYILIDELNVRCPPLALTLTYLITIIGNTILSCGSEELKKAFLPKILNAEMRIAICYSEPDAGNDIANIKTRAVLDGDEYVLNGSKRFITKADTSDYMWTLVRTEAGSARHKGLSLMLVKTDSPGISIVPVKMYHGITTCEVFLDDVRVPKLNLVGEPGKAWEYLMEALARERTTMINFKNVSEPFEKLVLWLKTAEIDGERLGQDPVVRQSVANKQLDISAGKMLQLIAGSRSMNKDYIPTMEGAASKIWRCLLAWDKVNLGIDIMRSYGILTDEHPGAPLDGWWAAEYGWAGHEMSGAGGLDLNRQIIAQQGLGLPRTLKSKA